MPVSSRGFARTSLALLFVGVLALIGIVGTTIWLVERTQIYFETMLDVREVRRASVELRNILQDAQAGQRGFILTRDEVYLAPYDDAMAEIWPAYNRLIAALSETLPESLQVMEGFRPDLETKLEELASTISLAREDDIQQALTIVRSNIGFELMAEMREDLDTLIADADESTLQAIESQRAAATALRIATIAGALIILGVIGAAIWLVLIYTRDLARARTEMEILNSDLEQRVLERTGELMRANEEVQRFAYIVTHDLRAPLVNIMGFTSELDAAIDPITKVVDRLPEDDDDADLTAARLAAKEDLPEAIGFIRSSTRKMDGLINAILKISREGQRKLKAERIDLTEAVEAAIASVRHQIDAEDGSVSVAIKAPPVFTDRLALGQILGNLLDNAIKYRQQGRALSITIEGHQEPSGRVVIAVNDNGRGIAPEDHGRVFELFRRSGTQDTTGEGIGLAHVRIMARNLGGDITLTSTPGEGTSFKVTLAPDLRAIVKNKG